MKEPEKSPHLEAFPLKIRQGDALTLRGTGWGGCVVQLRVDGTQQRGFHLLRGYRSAQGIQPEALGSFVAIMPSMGLKPGKHKIEAQSTSHEKEKRPVEFEVEKRKDETDEEEHGFREAPFQRQLELWRQRFSKLGYMPAGILAARQKDLQRLRGLQGLGLTPYAKPVTPGCNWTPMGPGAGYNLSTPSVIYSGKIHAIAIDPTNPSTVYAGASGGGVWKTTNSGLTWAPISDYQSSLAISTIAIDPNNNLHVIAGTGIDPIGILDYYGNGVLISSDRGNSWTEAGASIFNLASISRIIFDPSDATGQHLLLSSSLGVYESFTGGTSWAQLFATTATDMVLIVQPGGKLTVLVGVRFLGIFTSTFNAGSWSPFTQINDPSFTSNVGRVVFAQCAGTPKTVYAAFEDNLGADSLGTIVRTNDGGGSWAAVGKPGSASSQTWHAFVLAVHPTDPNTVFYGEVHLWKTTTGGAPWTQVTDILHADQNAFAFDPVTPTTVWAGNDGGIWRSSGSGAVGTWTHQNYGLATFKCIQGAHHPQWDSVFLISTQDTGTFRGDGQPVWPLIFGPADSGPVGIDPSQPMSYFTGMYHTNIWRSDNAGASFTNKTDGIAGNSLFYSPFVADPNNAGVCYFGADSLWRSPDHGDTWTQITNVLVTGFDPVTGFANALSAILPHPTDPNTIYLASSDGQVFQVQRTGATWTIPNVTVTNLTGAPLPASVSISSLALDGMGFLWASLSSILVTEDTGEFTNNHVYRYDFGPGTWSSQSTGLAVANPVNTIIADPNSATTLYCGADSGVFRTSDGMTWSEWDDGLPNGPVFQLLLHQPSRLLRAMLHGRSVWERAVDTTTCSSTDLYFRDDLLDTGRVQPSPSGVADPFTAGVTDYWYQSDDIKVDGPAPNFQTPSVITDFVTFEAVLQHTSPRRGLVNRFYGRVQNRGPFPATNVRVRAFFADAHAGLPLLPPDFWSNGAPFDADPMVNAWTPIGSTILISSVAPGMPAIFEWDWTVPTTANDHSCLLLLATYDQNALNASSTFVVDTLVPSQKLVTLKNLAVEDASAGEPKIRTQGLWLYNAYRGLARYDLVIDWATLPPGSELYLAFEKSEERFFAASDSDLKQAQAEWVKANKILPERYPVRCGDVDIDDTALRLPRPKDYARTVIPVVLAGRRSTLLLFQPVLPNDTPAGKYQFDIQQRTGTYLVGGNTYLLKLKPRK
jgi:hypothetical protein